MPVLRHTWSTRDLETNDRLVGALIQLLLPEVVTDEGIAGQSVDGLRTSCQALIFSFSDRVYNP